MITNTEITDKVDINNVYIYSKIIVSVLENNCRCTLKKRLKFTGTNFSVIRRNVSTGPILYVDEVKDKFPLQILKYPQSGLSCSINAT